MALTHPALYVVFVKAGDVAQRLKEAAKRAWTAPKDAGPGDIALFYFGGPGRQAIYAIGGTASMAAAGVPGRWTESEHGYFARHKDIMVLASPVYRDDIRATFPAWKRWKNLFGVRVHVVPTEYRKGIAKLIATRNPATQRLLTPWMPRRKAGSERLPFISDEGPWALEGLRTEIVAYRQGRSRKLRDRALARSMGVCEGCAVDYSALLHGKGVRVLQVHHRRQLTATDRPRITKLSDLAVLCANCHLLVHMNPKRALSVERLTTILREAKA